MPRRRFPLLALLVALLLPLSPAPAAWADEDGGKDPGAKKADPGPRRVERPATYGLAKLQQQLDGLRDRLIQIAEQANKDPLEREIEEYESYTLEQFQKKKDRVKVTDLVKYIFDPEANFELVRKRAVTAIVKVNQKFMDPDLSTERKGSSPSPRSRFCTRYVVKRLDDKDAKSRKLADELLTDLWGGKPGTLLGARNYRPEKQHSKTWDDAISDWKKYLKRR